MTRFASTFVVPLVTTTVGAQSPLDVAPNPFDARTDTAFVLCATGPETVTIDSLRMASTFTEFSYLGWYFNDTVYRAGEEETGAVQCDPAPFTPCNTGGLVGIPLAATDSVVAWGVRRYCATCRGVTGGIDDTLLVHVAGHDEPIAVEIVNGMIVAAEHAPEAAESDLDVYPNPARDRITVRLEVGAAGEAEAVVYDVTGRRRSGPSSRSASGACRPGRTRSRSGDGS